MALSFAKLVVFLSLVSQSSAFALASTIMACERPSSASMPATPVRCSARRSDGGLEVDEHLAVRLSRQSMLRSTAGLALSLVPAVLPRATTAALDADSERILKGYATVCIKRPHVSFVDYMPGLPGEGRMLTF